MSLRDHFTAALGPVHVHGKGLVTPKGWICPERRDAIAKVMQEQAEAEAAMAARTASPAPTSAACPPEEQPNAPADATPAWPEDMR